MLVSLGPELKFSKTLSFPSSHLMRYPGLKTIFLEHFHVEEFAGVSLTAMTKTTST